MDIVFSFRAAQEGLKIGSIPVACKYNDHTTKMRSTIIVAIFMLIELIRYSCRFKFSSQRHSPPEMEATVEL